MGKKCDAQPGVLKETGSVSRKQTTDMHTVNESHIMQETWF